MTTHQLKREELYELIWSEPMKTLAPRFGISDVGLAKACRRAEIPVSERGYWAKRQAGKPTTQIKLAPRPPGMSEEVIIGGPVSYWSRGTTDEEILGPTPPAPSFSESIDSVRARVTQLVGKVRVPKALQDAHPQIARLLEEDKRRVEYQKTAAFPSTWDNPNFDSAFERRRLRVLSGLFFAMNRAGCKPSAGGADGRELSVQVGQQHVGLVLERVRDGKRPTTAGEEKRRMPKERLRLEVKRWSSQPPRHIFCDNDNMTLEQQLQEIAIETIVSGETQYRENAHELHELRIQLKAELEEEAQKRAAEKARIERERQIKLEQQRIGRLLGEATALRQANEIRAYVDAVRSANLKEPEPLVWQDLDAWIAWALAQADRIDPIKTGVFLRLTPEEYGTATVAER